MSDNPSVLFRMFHTDYNLYTANGAENSGSDPRIRCQPNNCVKYNNLVVSGNDPSITQKSRFANNVKNSRYMRITVAQAIALGYLNPDGTINKAKNTPNTQTDPNGNASGGNQYVNRSYVNIANCPIYN